MPRMDKVSEFQTQVATGDEAGHVIYRGTCVVMWNGHLIKLNTGGWRTVTTKRKMNQASNQFGLGYQVFQKDHDWFITYRGTTIPFDSVCMTLDRFTFKIERAA